MRKVLALMIGCGFAFSALSQTITIKVNGNKNQKVIVDGRTYTPDNSRTGVTARTITITDLAAGTHNIQIVRNNRSNATTSFTTKIGYETTVVVAANGGVNVKNKVMDVAAARTPMSDPEFSTLLQRTRNHVRNSSRVTAVSNALANTNYYFTTTQLRMLLESFDGEVKRLELAKQAYPRITDQMNYATLSSLFSIQENRDALSAYVRTQGGDLVYSYSETFRSPLTNARFNTIIESVENQWQEGARLSTIIDVLENSSNYFSSVQALELIQLVADQSSRLHLAKAMYSRLTDPQNASKLYSLFDEIAYLQSFQSYITANSNTNVTGIHNYGKIAMTDTDFTRLYNSARSHFRTSSILKDVTAAITNTSNYFTSYQARQMIMLVKSETDRLQLAKSAYRGIVDPTNFISQMNDLFSWQASRDELANYVSSYVPQ
jgi:hypothetical protein